MKFLQATGIHWWLSLLFLCRKRSDWEYCMPDDSHHHSQVCCVYDDDDARFRSGTETMVIWPWRIYTYSKQHTSFRYYILYRVFFSIALPYNNICDFNSLASPSHGVKLRQNITCFSCHSIFFCSFAIRKGTQADEEWRDILVFAHTHIRT